MMITNTGWVGISCDNEVKQQSNTSSFRIQLIQYTQLRIISYLVFSESFRK